jgi:serine/threonine protein kinase
MNSREFKERYVFDPQHDLIAEGTYSRVFRAVDSLLQRDICIKYFRKELMASSPLIKELNRAGIFFHPNICAFYDLIEIEETNVLGEVDKQPIGIVEYVNGGMLTDYVRKEGQDPEMTKKLIKDVIKGLSYLHSLGRPHLDLKPGNLLYRRLSCRSNYAIKHRNISKELMVNSASRLTSGRSVWWCMR